MCGQYDVFPWIFFFLFPLTAFDVVVVVCSSTVMMMMMMVEEVEEEVVAAIADCFFFPPVSAHARVNSNVFLRYDLWFGLYFANSQFSLINFLGTFSKQLIIFYYTDIF